MSLFEIAVIEDGSTADDIFRQAGAVGYSEIPVDALFVCKSRPEDETGLREYGIPVPAPQRHDRIDLTFDVFAYNPRQVQLRRQNSCL